ncbi:MAG TPA: prepilin peptidase [Trueperaceae bacterium]|nr:prepilin peptidase [Trueperaceae bacterium]
MTAFILIVTGLAGLLIGSFINVVAYRVPAGIPLRRGSQCPNCGAPVKPRQNVPIVSWLVLGGRCASCGATISARYPLVEASTSLAFVGVTWLVLDSSNAASNPWALVFAVAAFLYFAAISIVLTLIDLDTHRLPNSIVLPAYPVAGVLFAAIGLLTGEWNSLLRAAVGMAVLYVFYFALRLVRPGGMGGGDVKLAGIIGIYLGWVGWGALAVGAFSAFLFGGVFGLALIALRRAGRKSAIPFGPWMILGAWAGILTGEAIGHWYVRLLTGV